MDRIDYKKLYALQDKVLKLIFSQEQEFYLIGGTCLSRFPQSLFKSINLIDVDFLHSFADEFPLIIEEINNKQVYRIANSK